MRSLPQHEISYLETLLITVITEIDKMKKRLMQVENEVHNTQVNIILIGASQCV